jgi:hypothetical protein
LEDPLADDIPTAVIRSKADLPNWDSNASLSTNDIVLGKLINILAEMRQGGKRRRKETTKSEQATVVKAKVNQTPTDSISTKRMSTIKNDDINIFDDIGDYELPQKRLRSSSPDSDGEDSTRKSNRHDRPRDGRTSMYRRDDNSTGSRNNLNARKLSSTSLAVDTAQEPQLNFNVMRPPSDSEDDMCSEPEASNVPNSSRDSSSERSSRSSRRSLSLSPVKDSHSGQTGRDRRSRSSSISKRSRLQSRSDRTDRSRSGRRDDSRSRRRSRSNDRRQSRRRSRSTERNRWRPEDKDRHYDDHKSSRSSVSSAKHRSRR